MPESTRNPTSLTRMFRRLILIVRHWSFSLRDLIYTLRSWVSEWWHLLMTPFREFHPRAFAVMMFNGVREILMMLRLVRPREFGSELMSSGREAGGMVRGSLTGVKAAVVDLFWLLVWLPWFLARACFFGPINTWYFLTTRSKRQLLYIAMGTVVIVGGAIMVPGYLYLEHRRTNRITLLQRQLEFFVMGSDVEKVETTLAELADMSPDDEALARRLAMVRDRNAPVSEPKLIRFFMRHHMVNGRVTESVREADKLLESVPDDWEARCYLADAAMRNGDRAGAERHLANLPRAQEVAETIPANVAVYSAFLFDRLGDRGRFEEMVEFITLNILPALRSNEMIHFPIGDKLFLIRCYFIALSQIEKRPQLTRYWDPVQHAYQSIMDDPAVDLPTLVLIGQVAQKDSLKSLQDFLRRRLVSKDEFNAMAIDVLERQKALWEDVLRREPQNASGYIGLAEYYSVIGNPGAAEEVAVRGLRTCGATQDLVAATAELLRRNDPTRGLAFLEALRDEDLTPRMCFVLEQVATSAGRRDKAGAACRKALEQDPKLYWARLRLGEICIELGRHTDAAAAFEPMKDELAKDPKGFGLYVQALCNCGAHQLAEEFLEKMSAKNCPVEALLQAAKGLQASRRPAETIRWAKRALDKDPLNVEALLLVADNTRILADNEQKGWDHDMAREALRNYRAVERQLPDNLVVVNNIVWLELKALDLPQDALASAAKLRAIQNTTNIPAEYLETLGAVYIGVGQYDQAVKVLKNAISTAGGRVSFYIHLALAYHGLKQYAIAEQYLNKAAEMPKSPRELNDLFDAARTIYRR
jgi:tetratricopeptide (TPR) repeat protein